VTVALRAALGVGSLGTWPGILIGSGGLPFLDLTFFNVPSPPVPASNACLAAATRDDRGARETTAPLAGSRCDMAEGDEFDGE